MVQCLLGQFFGADEMKISLTTFVHVFGLKMTVFWSKITVFRSKMAISRKGWKKLRHHGWMIQCLIGQFFGAIEMKIFLKTLFLFLAQKWPFWSQKLLFLGQKWPLVEKFDKHEGKMDDAMFTRTVFQCRRDENIF